jgi:glycosyltransferase involved in cell wall biosynthesis
MKKSLSILVISSDWRDLFRTDQRELTEKLERDQLEPGRHSFFFLAWSKNAYHARLRSFETVHIPLMFPALKPLGDIALVVLGPLIARWYGIKPDIVLVYDFGSLPAAKTIAAFSGAKVVLYLNNMPHIYSSVRRFGAIKSAYSGLMERLWHRLPDAYCTINETMRHYVQKIAGPKAKIFLYVVDTIARDRAHIGAATTERVRARLEIPDDQLLILAVGRLEAEKNFPRLLGYMPAVPNAHLVILGSGSLEGELKALARQLGVAERVHFEGFIQRDAIWNYYREADVFVLLSKAEALGIVFWEAMHARTPVIGSDLPGIVESLGSHGERGIILRDEATAEDFKTAIAFAATPSVERNAMIERAESFVKKASSGGTTISDVFEALQDGLA